MLEYRYHTGELNTPGFELMLHLLRLGIFVGAAIIISFVCWIIGLPPVIAGSLAGVGTFFLFLFGSFFEPVNITCPHCGYKARVLRDLGTYLCPQCQKRSFISKGEITKIEE